MDLFEKRELANSEAHLVRITQAVISNRQHQEKLVEERDRKQGEEMVTVLEHVIPTGSSATDLINALS